MKIKLKYKKQKVFSGIRLGIPGIIQLFIPIVLFVFILLSASLIQAEHLPIKTYTVADGLLRDTVFKVNQDSRGFS